VNISFPTQAGHSYSVLATGSLTLPVTWSTLATVSGNGAVQTVQDTISGTARYYRVAMQ
jgi:hypothetical protein